MANAIMDSIMSNDTFAKYGKWFSRDGWQIKHSFAEFLNIYLPLNLSRFIAEDFLVVFTELYKVSKMVMILSFLAIIFGFTFKVILVYICWGLLFSFFYAVIR
jgi:hypothetical protein